MQIVCSICRDAFTGADNETIYTTSCGHVFHHRCLVQWMQRSKTCPHCRMNLTNKNMFKLNLYFEGTAGPRNGLENAQQQTQQFEQAMKNIDMRQLRESARIATEQSKGLRLQVRKLEDELKAVKSRECDLLGKIRNLEQEVRSERQKNLHFGGSNQGADDDVIHLLDDSDPELLLDIDANLQQMRRNREQEPEVIDLDDTEMMNRNEPNQEIQDLKSQIEIKDVMLASAQARITELEKQNTWVLNGNRSGHFN